MAMAATAPSEAIAIHKRGPRNGESGPKRLKLRY